MDIICASDKQFSKQIRGLVCYLLNSDKYFNSHRKFHIMNIGEFYTKYDLNKRPIHLNAIDEIGIMSE